MQAQASILLALLGLMSAAGAQQPLPNLDRRTPAVLAVQNVGPAVVNIRSQDQARRVGRNFRMFERFEAPRRSETDPKTGERFTDRSLGSGVIVSPRSHRLCSSGSSPVLQQTFEPGKQN